MKKITLMVLIVLILAIVVIQPALAQQVIIRGGHSHSTDHAYHKAFEMWKELLEKRSDKFVVEIFPASQLGNDEQMTEMVKLGKGAALQAVITGRYEEMGRELYTYNLPFLFKDFKHAQRVLNSPIGDYIASFCELNNLKVLGWSIVGFRQITNNGFPIKTPDDLVGIKMRTPPTEDIIKTMTAFGASPTSIAYDELYMALKTGVADAQENPYMNIVSEHLYEVQDWCTEVNYRISAVPFAVNLEWFNNFSPEDQKMLSDTAKSACIYADSIAMAQENEYKQECIKNGMQIYVPSEEERQAFIDNVQSVYDFYVEDGVTTQEIIDMIQSY